MIAHLTDGWLREATLRALDERGDVHTPISAYAEVSVLFYDAVGLDRSPLETYGGE